MLETEDEDREGFGARTKVGVDTIGYHCRFNEELFSFKNDIGIKSSTILSCGAD